MSKATIRKRVKDLMAEWEMLRFGLSEQEAAEAWAESIAFHEDKCPDIAVATKAARKPEPICGHRLAQLVCTSRPGHKYDHNHDRRAAQPEPTDAGLCEFCGTTNCPSDHK